MASMNFSCDGVVNGMVRCLRGKGYIRNLKKNLRDLEREIEEIKAIQDDVQNKIAREDKAGDRQTLKIVQLWLTNFERIDTQFNELHNVWPIQDQLLCFFGGKCSKNGWSSYNYGKKIYLLLEEAKKLKLKGHFEEVTEPTLRSVVEEVGKFKSEGNLEEASTSASRSVVEERPIGDTIGQETMLETAWSRLMEDRVGIMGLHGMGGVGKTTLFKKIHNKFVGMVDRFDIVIWVVVSQGSKISKLQHDIAEKLNLNSQSWRNKNGSDKAAVIYTYLQKKRFVLMLDDIWKKVDLDEIGVPNPTRENGCKVAFTTRSLDVCKQMKDHEPMQVNCLGKDEAWELFKKTIGDNTLERDDEIMERAMKVAEKCGGLPLALCVIGETMASKTTIQEWDYALNALATSAAEFSDVENKILVILKFSYDNLVDARIKNTIGYSPMNPSDIQSCFLYCAIFEEDARIKKERLIDYWICEGFMGEYKDLEIAKNKAYDVLGTLVRANLLIAEVDGGYSEMHGVVVMHDVVREMALWIASNFGNQKENFVVQANLGLSEVPVIKDWTAVRRMSLMRNKIEEITCGSRCPQLITLLLHRNYLKNLSGEFIGSMQKLVVLDLSNNFEFNELPNQILKLVSLQYLDLSCTSIERLPVGLQKLKKLFHLDLSNTKSLCSIRGISKLSSLRILKLEYSKACGDVNLVKELKLLEKLEFLTITVSTELVLERISSHQRLANCIQSLKIRNFKQTPLDISLLMSMKNLRELSVTSCDIWKTDLSDSTIPCFTKLSNVAIFNCNGIKDLTWLLFTPNLVSLFIYGAEEVKEIINKEKATDFKDSKPFQKLRYMYLRGLPKLESIYWSPLPFPLLKYMELNSVPKLSKLPLDAASVQRINEFKIRIYPEEQKTDLEWEDEDTENRFFPLCTRPYDKLRNSLALALSPVVKALVDPDGAMKDIRNLDNISFSDLFMSKVSRECGILLLMHSDMSARCMLTIFSLFATKTEASLLRMLKGSPDVYLSGPIKQYITDRGGRIHLRWGCREILYDKSADGETYVTGLAVSKATDKKTVKADVYVAACDVPGIKRLLPKEWRESRFFNDIYELEGVPVVTVQLRYNGWVTELQDIELSRQLKRAVGLDNLLYTPDADFSCFADLALASPADYYIEGQGTLLQCVLTPGDPYMRLTNDKIIEKVAMQVTELFPSSRNLEVTWSSVVKIAQSLYREAPGKDPFRPDQKTPIKNFFLAGSYTKQDYIDSMEGATLSGRQASSYICDAGEELAELNKKLCSSTSSTAVSDEMSFV